MALLLSTDCLVRNTLMSRMLVISFATMIRNSHCKAAATAVITRILRRTFACPLTNNIPIKGQYTATTREWVEFWRFETYSVAAAATAVQSRARIVNR